MANLGRENLKGVQGAHLEDRAIGYGTGKQGALVGKRNAVWALVTLAGVGEIDVPHALGDVPIFCVLHDWDGPAGVFLAAKPVNPSKWTKTTCRVEVYAIAGSAAGVVARFQVGGQ